MVTYVPSVRIFLTLHNFEYIWWKFKYKNIFKYYEDNKSLKIATRVDVDECSESVCEVQKTVTEQ